MSLNIMNGVPWSPSRRSGAGLPNPLNIRLIIAALFVGLLGLAAPASAQFNVNTGAASVFCVRGPGDIQPYTTWNGLRAFSMAKCGQRAVNACDSTGGVDNACADMVTDKSTGKLVPQAIGSLTCGTDNSGNCTVKIIYDQTGNNACSGSVACDAVQNTIANRYNLYGSIGCNAVYPCMFSSAAGAGYTMAGSLSLTQPFALVAVAYTANFSATNTLISVGNANIHFASASPGNVLGTCDSSGGTTAANSYQLNSFPSSLLSDIFLICLSGSGTTFQNMFVGSTLATGGSTSVSGTPVIGANGGSNTNLWEFGITTANLTPITSTGFWNPFAIHSNACTAWGYTCYYSGAGDVASFKAYWGMRAYSSTVASTAAGQRLFNACSADNTLCSDIMSQPRTGGALNGTVGGTADGTGNKACWIGITAGTYNSTTGAAVLTVNSSIFQGLVTGLVSGNNFAISNLAGTGAFASLAGGYVATTGTGSTTVNFTAPTGLGAAAITSGTLSTCTIKMFYDLSGANFCTGGVACDLTQTTVANRAIWTYNCLATEYPIFYQNSCATFVAANSDGYTGPGTTTTAEPFSVVWAAMRSGAFTTQQTVINCNCASGFPASTNNAFMFDGNATSAIGAAANSLFHSIVGESDSANTRIYVDGVLAGTTAGTGGNMSQPYSIGTRGGGQFLQGQFLEGGIINSDITSSAAALSAQQHLFWPF